ncbi:MAG: hypothetical protein SOU51_04470 [Collinsella sp.]|nr:hypothetical protein [Collinsella sp.]
MEDLMQQLGSQIGLLLILAISVAMGAGFYKVNHRRADRAKGRKRRKR